MNQIAVVGGAGSSERMMDDIVKKVRKTPGYDGKDVVGLPLRKALYDENIDLGELFGGASVLTHSTGAVVLKEYLDGLRRLPDIDPDMVPESAFMIAPPLQTTPFKLALRAIASFKRPLEECGYSSAKELAAAKLYSEAGRKEFARYPIDYMWILKASAGFDMPDLARTARKLGIPTTAAYMKTDHYGLASPRMIDELNKEGVAVSEVSGHHDRFIHNPVAILEAMHEAVQRRPTNFSREPGLPSQIIQPRETIEPVAFPRYQTGESY